MKNDSEQFLKGIQSFLRGKTYVDPTLKGINSGSTIKEQNYKTGYLKAKEITLKEHLHNDSYDSILQLHFKFNRINTDEAVFTKSYMEKLEMKSLMEIEKEVGLYVN